MKHPLLFLLSLSSFAPFGAFSAQPSEKPYGRVNFPSNYQVEQGSHLFVEGEYLYWRPTEEGLYFAQQGFQNPAAADGFTFQGNLKKIDAPFNSGLRLRLGTSLPKSGMEVAADWTWFGMTNSKSVSGSILPLWAEPDFVPFASALGAKGTWHLDFNLLNLTWGRSSWFGEHLSLSPFLGITGAWIDQHFNTEYTYATIPIAFAQFHMTSDFRGGGVCAGSDIRFVLPYDLSFYGKGVMSLLLGQMRADVNATEDALLIARSRDHFVKNIFALQLGVGISWDTHFAKDRAHLEIHIGWEQNGWFKINQMSHFLNQLHTGTYFQETGNLFLQGLIVGSRLDF